MTSLNDLVQAVKQFRNHNAAREARHLNRLIELGGLNKAIQTLERTAQTKDSDTERILASIKELNNSLTTFGQSGGRGDLREEPSNLYELIRLAANMRRASIGFLVDLGT